MVPQIIHFNRVFHHKQSIFWGTPIFGNTQLNRNPFGKFKIPLGPWGKLCSVMDYLPGGNLAAQAAWIQKSRPEREANLYRKCTCSSYCWWILHHLGRKKSCKKWEKNYQPQLVSRISSINSIQVNFLKYPNGVGPAYGKGVPLFLGGPGSEIWQGIREKLDHLLRFPVHLYTWVIRIDMYWYTLQGTNISPKNCILKMIFLFPRWDMLIPWRVIIDLVTLYISIYFHSDQLSMAMVIECTTR